MVEGDTRAVLERYVDAWSAGDLGGLVACYHPEMELHWFGANPLSGVHAGRAAALASLGAMASRTNRTLIGVDGLMVERDRALLITRERFERDGRTAEIERLLLFRVEGGLLRECRVYDADQRLIDSFLA